MLLNTTLYLLPYLSEEERDVFLNHTVPYFVKEDLLAYYVYWQDAIEPLTRFGRWVYDVYLKGNGIEAGIQSYGRFISYIIYQRQSGGTDIKCFF